MCSQVGYNFEQKGEIYVGNRKEILQLLKTLNEEELTYVLSKAREIVQLKETE